MSASATAHAAKTAAGRLLWSGLPVTTIFILICWFGVYARPVGAHDSLKRFEYRQVHMGLQVRILLYAPGEAAAVRAATAAFDEIARLDAIMSDYRRDSELMELVTRAGEGPVSVSPDLFKVLATADVMARRSGGAFDVTVSPLVRLWREARKTGRLPDPVLRDSALAITGFNFVRLDSTARTVTLSKEGMQLDLGGIAKGYAADRALKILADHGAERALIEFGGDVRVGAPPPGRPGWRVEVAHADSAHRFIELAHGAVASSGDTEQFVIIDGTRYSHVVDPHTGLGLTTRIAATVVAADGITADALATSLTILAPAAGDALLAEHYPEARAYRRSVGEDGGDGVNSVNSVNGSRSIHR